MRAKEFKHLNRAELVEIIYQLQQDNQKLTDENAELRAKLASKDLRLSKAGSIAEAVVGLSDIFAVAQEAADNYLSEIHRNHADIEAEQNKLIAEAEARARDILRQAELAADEKLNAATEESEQKWKDVNSRIEQLMQSHDALKRLLE